MVQSEVEVIKLNSLVQKVLYKWLESSRYLGFHIELEIPHLTILVNSNSLEVTSSHESGHPRCSVFLRKVVSCPYDYWEQGVADYELCSSVCFCGRGKLLYDFKRTHIGTSDVEWYPYVSEILAPLNESQRFGLDFILREVLKELERKIEFRKRISNAN